MLVKLRQLWVLRRNYNRSSSADRGRWLAPNIKRCPCQNNLYFEDILTLVKWFCMITLRLGVWIKKWSGAKPIIVNQNVKSSWQSKQLKLWLLLQCYITNISPQLNTVYCFCICICTCICNQVNHSRCGYHVAQISAPDKTHCICICIYICIWDQV